ncbi:Uncharacterized protein PHSC3_001907 [Chlamydiales bacterium STE3]|nr:Uncharacterized protein PHSC3_001907 [Chlamydiales bacterium STE3]
MDEYHYYEFQAIDCFLTDKEMEELRTCSTRAEITPNSFSNAYTWSHFKGDEDLWLEKYFDAFFYHSSCGSRSLKFRMPPSFTDYETVVSYCNGTNASARTNNEQIFIEFSSQGTLHEEEGIRLSSFLSLREELDRGDLRCLYLGWLANMQNGCYADHVLEPAVPPGLSTLSQSLQDLAKFLRIDQDLLKVATVKSACSDGKKAESLDLRSWLKQMSAEDKEKFLGDILEGSINGDYYPVIHLIRHFNLSNPLNQKKMDSLRTVGELCCEYKKVAEEHCIMEQAKAAAKLAEEERVNKLIKQKRFNELIGSELLVWEQIELFMTQRHSSSYNKALDLLATLRDLAKMANEKLFFDQLKDFQDRHSRKLLFMEELQKLLTS